jgi:hypothetical protein
MPTGERSVKREHVESYIARRRDEVNERARAAYRSPADRL